MKYFYFKKREYADCCLFKIKDTQTLLIKTVTLNE